MRIRQLLFRGKARRAALVLVLFSLFVDSACAWELFEPAVSGRGPILSALKSAKKRIDLGIYDFADAELGAALASAVRRGAEVRVLINTPEDQGRGGMPKRFRRELEAAGVLVREAPKRFYAYHAKFCVVDGSRALVMTFNWKPKYFKDTLDYGATLDAAAGGEEASAVRELADLFEADWTDRPTPRSAHVAAGPETSRERIVGLIRGATKSILIENKELDDWELTDLLVAKAKSGVMVRLATNRPGPREARSETMHGRIRAAGGAVEYASGVYLHAKRIRVDESVPGRGRFYVGSQNLVFGAFRGNREVGVVLPLR